MLAIDALIVGGYPLGHGVADIERELLVLADSERGGGTWGMFDPSDSHSAPGERRWRFDGNTWEPTTRTPDATIRVNDVGANVQYATAATPVGPSVARRSAAVWNALTGAPDTSRRYEPLPATIDHFTDVAEHYDDEHGPPPTAMIDVISDLAAAARHDGRPRALEFGVGTGRVAIELAVRGVDVIGVDRSPSMLAVIASRSMPSVEGIEGDMATTDITASHGRFGVVYLVFNTIMNLTTQSAQTAVFANAARHLLPGGSFAVEVVVPELWRLAPGERTLTFADDDGDLGYDEYASFVDQRLVSHHRWSAGGEERHEQIPFRWVWPSEFDLMAELAGLALTDRWNDWDRTPFTDDSTFHVSVYRKPA